MVRKRPRSEKRVRWRGESQLSYYSESAPPCQRDDPLELIRVIECESEEYLKRLLSGLLAAKLPNSRLELELKGARMSCEQDLDNYVYSDDAGLRLHVIPGEPVSREILEKALPRNMVASMDQDVIMRILVEQRCWEDMEDAGEMKEHCILRELSIRGEGCAKDSFQEKVEKLRCILKEENLKFQIEDAVLENVQNLVASMDEATLKQELGKKLKEHFQCRLKALGLDVTGNLPDLAIRLEIFRKLQESAKFKFADLSLNELTYFDLLDEAQSRSLVVPDRISEAELRRLVHCAVIEELPKLPIRFEFGISIDIDEITPAELPALQRFFKLDSADIAASSFDPATLYRIRNSIVRRSEKMMRGTIIEHIRIASEDMDRSMVEIYMEAIRDSHASMSGLISVLEEILKYQAINYGNVSTCCSCNILQIALTHFTCEGCKK
jgi:hypothetical protein